MKRALLFGTLLVGASILGGCPIYPEDPYACTTNSDCAEGFACDHASGDCYPVSGPGPTGKSCSKPSDCDGNQTCGKTGKCATGSCAFHGCVSGYTCAVAEGVWACVKDASGGAGGGGGSAGHSGGQAGAASGGAAGQASGGTAGAASGGAAGQTDGGGSGGTSDAASDAAGGSAGANVTPDAASDASVESDASVDASAD